MAVQMRRLESIIYQPDQGCKGGLNPYRGNVEKGVSQEALSCAGVRPSMGSFGDDHDNATAEPDHPASNDKVLNRRAFGS